MSDFDDAGSWTFSQARADGSLAATPDGHTGTGLRLTYDFTRSTATRAAYAAPPRPVAVPGRPQAYTLWIKGDGNGAWPTLHLKDAAGSDQLLRGPYVTWTGWRQVTFAVPPGAAMPLTVSRFYLAETAAARQYTGEIVIDDLTAQVPPDRRASRTGRARRPVDRPRRRDRGPRLAVRGDVGRPVRRP